MNNKKILIMGLPGSGKTTLAKKLKEKLNAVHWNADDVRSNINKDLSFIVKDRIEQARRMGWLCDRVIENDTWCIADFVCPTDETRNAFGECITIWVDTIKESVFQDTNNLFVPPKSFDYRVSYKDCEYWANLISSELLYSKKYNIWNNKAPTVQLLGRWQPWHDGHTALFKRALTKTGQVCIMVRDTGGEENNPFDFQFVKTRIIEWLQKENFVYNKDYIIKLMPNIVNITYGRDVGYKIEQEVFDDAIHSISATKIRKEMENKN